MRSSPRRRNRHAPQGVTPHALQWARGETGLSQAQVADESGVNLRSLSAWERGDAVPQVATLGPLLRWYRLQGIDVATMSRVDPGVTIALDDEDLNPAVTRKALRDLQSLTSEEATEE